MSAVEKHIAKDLERDQLSSYLPYLAYDQETAEFLNHDSTFGIMFECSPLYFVDQKTTETLASIIKQDYGPGAILQFVLFADTDIGAHCEEIIEGDTRQMPLTKKMRRHHVDFLNNPESYAKKIKDNKLKNFRLFVALKTKQELSRMLVAAFDETLLGAGLNPRPVDANALLSLLRKILNTNNKNIPAKYNTGKDISSQAIYADTCIDFSAKDHIKIDGRHISVLTPKEYPEANNKQSLSSIQVNELIGSFRGGINDLEQITSSFIWSCNILLDPINGELLRKEASANVQRKGAKLNNNISDRIKALGSAVKNLGPGHYLRFIPSLVLFERTEDKLSTATTRVKRLWEKQGFNMQKETYIKHIMFIASLPFGLYLGRNNSNISTLDRHFIATSTAIAGQLPLQGDFRGFGNPVVPFIGRKGQVLGLDLFSENANNHNFLCCAETGSGKSFVVNWILAHYFGSGAKIRVIDIGGSYKKMANMFNGAYIDISDNSVNLNPFMPTKGEIDEDDRGHDLETIVMVLGEMIYSTTRSGELTNTQTGLLTQAAKAAIKEGVLKDSIDFIQKYLKNIGAESKESVITPELESEAKVLSFNLHEFSSKGTYGPLFNGISENTWKSNPFVVLELEGLQNKPALMKVVTLQVINMMTQEMYQGDKSEKKMAIFDEVALMFSNSQRLSQVVENGYRRARKYRGSFGAIFQSIMDTRIFGDVGEVMMGNAAFKFFLQSSLYPRAIKEGLLNYEGLAKELLCSVMTVKPHYSEIFMDTPGGVGVARLMVGPYGHAVATTNGADVKKIESYIEDGLSTDEALEKFASTIELKKA